MLKARKVDEYFFTEFPNEDPPKNYLGKMFDNCTIDTSVTPNKMLFQNIYLPVRKVITVDGVKVLEDQATYYNVGLTSAEIAELYWTEYSGNYLIGRKENISQDAAQLQIRLKSVLRKNLGKYLKLIEQYGLEWNPLWNVDGTEIRQTLENQGVNDVQSGPQDTTNGITTEHQVSAYDSALKSEYKDIQKGKVETTYTHNNAKNIVEGSEADYEVSASDTAFGYALKGGDKMHIEKYLRQGNIGVTKTTELLEDARRYLRFSVIQEYFDDINKVILIGVYDN